MIGLMTLFLGCFFLGSVVAYLLWMTIRPFVLEAEIRAIIARLEIEIDSSDLANEANYLAFKDFAYLIISNIKYLSVPVLLNWLKINRSYVEAGETGPLGSDYSRSIRFASLLLDAEKYPPEVVKAATQLLLCIFRYLLWTPASIFLLVRHVLSGRTEKLLEKLFASIRTPVDIEKLVAVLK